MPAASPAIPDTPHLPWHSPRQQHSAKAWSRRGHELLAKPRAGAQQGPGGERSLGLGEGQLLPQQEQGPRDAGGCQGRSMALPHSIANVRGLCWGVRQLS